MSGPYFAGRSHQRVRQATWVEAAPDDAWVAGLGRHERGAQRLEPVECVIEPLDDQPLEPRVAVRALAAEFVERAVAPDDPARKQHRAARPIAFLEHHRREAELSGPRRGAEPGHARAGDKQLGEREASLCSTYSIRTRSGPQTKTAYVFGASTTSSISTPSSSASEMCSSADSTSTARWFSSGRAGWPGSPSWNSTKAPPTSTRGCSDGPGGA